MPAKIIDLSTAAPDPVIVRIGNGDDIQEINLTIVPAAVSLRLAEAIQKYGGWDQIPDGELLDAIATITTRANPAVTAEWLRETCTRQQILTLYTIVYGQAFRMWGGGGGNSKNVQSRWAESSPASPPSTAGLQTTASGPSPGTR